MARAALFLCTLAAISVAPSAAQAACTNPAGPAGNMFYNTDNSVMQWCDGTDWIGLPPPSVSSQPVCELGTISSGSMSQIDTISNTDLNGAYRVKVVGNYAYVGSQYSDSLTVIDISNPANLTQVGTFINNTDMDGARDMAVVGDYAFVTGFNADSLTAIDISDPANLTQVDTISDAALEGAMGVTVVGDYAYVAASFAVSLTVIDISNPANLTQVSTFSSTDFNRPHDVVVAGNYAYLTGSSADSLTVVDISDPANITQVGTISNAALSGAQAVAVAGNYAYVAASFANSLTVIDISDPANLTQAGTVSSAALNYPWAVELAGDYAYVGSNNADSLTVIDITDPANPTQVGTISSMDLDGATDVVVVGEYVYVASWNADSLTVIDTGCTLSNACTNPYGVAGTMIYNNDHSIMQWCDGSQWVGVPKNNKSPWQQTTVGFNNGCGIRTDGTAWCWGGGDFSNSRNYGQLGYGGKDDQNLPVQVIAADEIIGGSGWSDWQWVGGAFSHGCGLRTNGTAWCWGTGVSGRLGSGGTSEHLDPVQVVAEGQNEGGATWNDWEKLSVGGGHNCGIRTGGGAWCWGYGRYSQLGYGGPDPEHQFAPVQVVAEGEPIGGATWNDWEQISTGYSHTCGIRTNGTAWCWGLGGLGGHLGYGATSSQSAPVQVVAEGEPEGGATWSDWQQISAGDDHSCGIRTNGTAWCWGSGMYGRLGYGGTDDQYVPVPVVAEGEGIGGATWNDWEYVGTGAFHSCGLRTNGTAWCWGASGTAGRLGYGGPNPDHQSAPVQVVAEGEPIGGATWNDWQQISVKGNHSCGIRTNGSVWCWGVGEYGRLGYGGIDDKLTPVQVGMGNCSLSLSRMMLYNEDHAVMQWCDGNKWHGFPKPPVDKTVFVTSTTSAGNLGHLSGADSICNTRAAAGGLSGTYKAWLATGGVNSPNDSRFNKTAGALNLPHRYVLTNGTVIATGWADLTDGTLAAPIDRDEFGNLQSGIDNVWTNVAANGTTVSTTNCSNWTTSSGGSNRGERGNSSATDTSWTYASGNGPQCNNALRLYCFEQ